MIPAIFPVMSTIRHFVNEFSGVLPDPVVPDRALSADTRSKLWGYFVVSEIEKNQFKDGHSQSAFQSSEIKVLFSKKNIQWSATNDWINKEFNDPAMIDWLIDWINKEFNDLLWLIDWLNQ